MSNQIFSISRNYATGKTALAFQIAEEVSTKLSSRRHNHFCLTSASYKGLEVCSGGTFADMEQNNQFATEVFRHPEYPFLVRDICKHPS